MPMNRESMIEKEVMGQAYQVIATIAAETSMTDHADIQRALDYFAANEYHENFLPFSMKPTNNAYPTPDNSEPEE